jgi:hypothetical protein
MDDAVCLSTIASNGFTVPTNDGGILLYPKKENPVSRKFVPAPAKLSNTSLYKIFSTCNSALRSVNPAT